MDMKRCTKCGEDKPLSEYNRCAASPDGLKWYCRVCANACARSHYRENRDHYIRQVKRWQREHPKATDAREAAALAVARGELSPQGCEVCSATEDIHAHHDDYDKPLGVRWLCRSHHWQHHARLAKTKALAAG